MIILKMPRLLVRDEQNAVRPSIERPRRNHDTCSVSTPPVSVTPAASREVREAHREEESRFTSLTSRTGLRDLTTDTRIVNSRFFGNDPEAVPAQALSVGIGTVTDSKEVLVLISGHNKARAMAAVVEGGVSQKWTCSALQMHN